MPQVSTGPELSAEEESDHRREQLQVELVEAENGLALAEQTVADLQESLKGRRDEVARLRAELEG